MMIKEERDEVEAAVLNLLTDGWIQARTHDWHDYEGAKNLVRNSREHWRPEEWEVAMQVCAQYCAV